MTHSINELLAIGHSTATLFRTTFGYSTADFEGIRVTEDGAITLIFDLIDDFQRDLTYDLRVDSGYGQRIPLAEVKALHPTTWRTREQRELAVMARRFADLGVGADEIESAQVRAFLDTLKPLGAELAGLLETPRRTEDAALREDLGYAS